MPEVELEGRFDQDRPLTGEFDKDAALSGLFDQDRSLGGRADLITAYCSNRLDFSEYCNSQYIAAVGA